MVINISNDNFDIWVKNYKFLSEIVSTLDEHNNIITIYGTDKNSLLSLNKDDGSYGRVFNKDELVDMMFDISFDVLDALIQSESIKENSKKISW